MARIQYEQQLKDMRREVLYLESLLEDTIRKTIQALVHQNEDVAREVATSDDTIDAQVKKIEHMCQVMFWQQQPVASDLREISAISKMMTDMERIGDHGADISEITLELIEQDYPLAITKIEKMSKEVMVMLLMTIDAWDDKDEEKAKEVIAKDDVIDDLFVEIKKDVIADIAEHQETAEKNLDMFIIAKYLERIGDHATNIAEATIYALHGDVD